MTETVSSDTAGSAARPAVPGEAAASYAELLDDLRRTYASGHTRPIAWRRSQLDALSRLLAEHEDELLRALHDDLGRPVIEGFVADLAHTRGEIAYLKRHVDQWARPRRVPLPITSRPGRARIVPEPLGVVLVIAPWNYPVQLLLEPMAAALAAGNCVVAKPSELAPATSAVLSRLLPRYLDDSAVVVVEGGVDETSALLEQRFDHVFFTGSTQVGRIVMQAAARHLTPVTLELGGKSPVIVASDADLEVTARRIAWGKHLNAGQTCIAPDYVLAESTVRDRLVDLIVAAQRSFLGDDPKASPDFGRIVNERHLQRLSGLLDGHGGTIAAGGDFDPTTRWFAPTVVVDPDTESPLMQEEIFGPILPVCSVEHVDEAIGFVNDRPKPLALYIFSSSDETIDRVIDQTSSGGVCANQTLMQILPPTLPFGGVGDSGSGAYHGKAGFDVFTHEKSVLAKPTRPDPSLLYPPYTRWKQRILRRFA